MNNVADRDRRINPSEDDWEDQVEFFRLLARRKIDDWPEGHPTFSTPYAFNWPGDEFREQFINCMVADDSGRTHFPAGQLLRWLLFRFRVAQRRKIGNVAEFKRYRWTWARNEVVRRKTGLSDYQLRSAVKFLTQERRLIVRRYDLSVENHIPHYRPTHSLFRAAHLVCLANNSMYLQAAFPDTWFADEHSDHMKMILDNDELYGRLATMLTKFSMSTERARANVLCKEFFTLMDYVLNPYDYE